MALQHLRELHYERCEYPKLPTASTFAYKSASPLDQLLVFAKTIGWLLKQIGGSLATFSEYDEPNAIAMEVLNACRPYVQTEGIGPHELRQGSGDVVCRLLLAVTEAVLSRKPPKQQEWKTNQEQHFGAQKDDEDDENNDEEIFEEGLMGTFKGGATQRFLQQQIAPGIVDANIWQNEVTMVEPQLAAAKFAVSADWRPDINNISKLNNGLKQQTQSIQQQL